MYCFNKPKIDINDMLCSIEYGPTNKNNLTDDEFETFYYLCEKSLSDDHYIDKLKSIIEIYKEYTKKQVYTLSKEPWICSDGEYGGWFVYQCSHCQRYIPSEKIETKKHLIDKRVKYCPFCHARCYIDDSLFGYDFTDFIASKNKSKLSNKK